MKSKPVQGDIELKIRHLKSIIQLNSKEIFKKVIRDSHKNDSAKYEYIADWKIEF